MRELLNTELLSIEGGVFYVSGCPHNCGVICAYVVSSTGIPTYYFDIIDQNVGLYINNVITENDLYWNTIGVPINYLTQYNENFSDLIISCM